MKVNHLTVHKGEVRVRCLEGPAKLSQIFQHR